MVQGSGPWVEVIVCVEFGIHLSSSAYFDLQKHADKWIHYSELAIGVNEYDNWRERP